MDWAGGPPCGLGLELGLELMGIFYVTTVDLFNFVRLTIDPLLTDRQTYTIENIIFRELRWQALMTYRQYILNKELIEKNQ